MTDQVACIILWHILFNVHIYKLVVGLVGICCAMAARDCLGARQRFCRRCCWSKLGVTETLTIALCMVE
jgi:hypothetical protein